MVHQGCRAGQRVGTKNLLRMYADGNMETQDYKILSQWYKEFTETKDKAEKTDKEKDISDEANDGEEGTVFSKN